MPDPLDALAAVIDQVVAPAAADVDRDATFPDASIAALGDAGILGLVSARDIGGGGAGLDAAAVVIEQLAGACGSTAMVVLMHYAATAMIEAHGSDELRRSIAGGEHLTTLAFSEIGSRSHFWAPQSTAVPDASGGMVVLDAAKSWVTAAGHAGTYVWSSTPLEQDGPMTLWAVPAHTEGLAVGPAFDGFGLRGNESVPVTAADARVPRDAVLGTDGAGLDLALQIVLPCFLVLVARSPSGSWRPSPTRPGGTCWRPASSISTSRSRSSRSPASTSHGCASTSIARGRSSPTRSPRSPRRVPTRCSGCSR